MLIGAERPLTPSDEPVMWSADEASRWIFRRVLELGWTPERFGDYDEAVRNDSRHYQGPRTERIGKKYQWIALHELLARIADHCPYRGWSTDDPEPYEGPWQLHLRDIDPSITFEPAPVPEFDGPRTWWQPLDIPIGPFDDSGQRDVWALSDADVPTVDDVSRLLRVEDRDGVRWLALEGMYDWKEDTPPHLGDTHLPKSQMWLLVRSYLVPRRAFQDFAAWARRQDWFGRWMPEGPQISQVFLGEWPLLPAAGDYADELAHIERRTGADDPAPVEVAPTGATYNGIEGDSLLDAVSHDVPGRRLMVRQGLRRHADSLQFDDTSGRPAAFDPSASERGASALLHDEELLRELIDDDDSSVVWTILGEKNVLSLSDRPDRILVMTGVATLESGAAEIEVGMSARLDP